MQEYMQSNMHGSTCVCKCVGASMCASENVSVCTCELIYVQVCAW